MKLAMVSSSLMAKYNRMDAEFMIYVSENKKDIEHYERAFDSKVLIDLLLQLPCLAKECLGKVCNSCSLPDYDRFIRRYPFIAASIVMTDKNCINNTMKERINYIRRELFRVQSVTDQLEKSKQNSAEEGKDGAK
ncbi:MAG: hypothetical protein WCY30_03355 [Candidatus Neomarinimicrobiota bacterium]|jgi:hypothetical protein